jgi:hypothetical protein
MRRRSVRNRVAVLSGLGAVAMLLIFAAIALAVNIYYVGAPGAPGFIPPQAAQYDAGFSYNSYNHMIAFTNSGGTTRCSSCSVTVVLFYPNNSYACVAGGTESVACGFGGAYQYTRAYCYHTNAGYIFANCYKERNV